VNFPDNKDSNSPVEAVRRAGRSCPCTRSRCSRQSDKEGKNYTQDVRQEIQVSHIFTQQEHFRDGTRERQTHTDLIPSFCMRRFIRLRLFLRAAADGVCVDAARNKNSTTKSETA
jgi:hypothetical protein